MALDQLPAIGLGTYGATGTSCAGAVETALNTGYRHIDTAEMYDNQEAVGRGIQAANVARSEVFIATKIAPKHLSYDDVLAHAKDCRDRLNVNTIDLLYIHWPLQTYAPSETLPAMDTLIEQGVIRHIGLSNFPPAQLNTAMDMLDAPVFAHQVECHPLLPQRELRAIAQDAGHTLVAYCPLARGAVLDHPEIIDTAARLNLTPAQVTLAWLQSKGSVVPIPKSTTKSHIRENLAACDITLDTAAIQTLDSIEERNRIVDFSEAPWH